ncbi:MAG: sigma 54-interacting transcriptional regulator [Kiritimatiellia bacterium]
MTPSMDSGRDENVSRDDQSEVVEHLEIPPRITFRPVGGGCLSGKKCDPVGFALVHEGAAKWQLHEPTSFGHWRTHPLTERGFLAWCDATKFAESNLPLLISGEKGTGKQELATLIAFHEQNPRRNKRFEVVDCEAVQPNEIALDLFAPDGKLVACNGGTVLLVHVDCLSPDCRRRLVHLMKRGEVLHVGAGGNQRNVNIRLIATVRLDEHGRVPDMGELAEAFVDEERLNSLKNMDWAISELLSEFLCPHEFVKDVHVNWLLDLMCHSWPGNIAELHRYCERVRARSRGNRCSVLNEVVWPLSGQKGDLAGIVSARQIVSALLAIHEQKIRKTDQWPKGRGVSDIFANSLRLLAQLHVDAEYDSKDAIEAMYSGFYRPHYYHPYAIPLALHHRGCRTPACYDMSAVILKEELDDCRPLHGFLSALARLAADPSELMKNEEFRVSFGSDPGVIANLRPSEDFLRWIGWLKASVPKYEEMRPRVVPAPVTCVPMKGKPVPGGKKTPQVKPGKDNPFFTIPGMSRGTFKWRDVRIVYLPKRDEAAFAYKKERQGVYRLDKLPGLYDGKTKRPVEKSKAGKVLQMALERQDPTFTLMDVMNRCKATNHAAAAECVRRLNRALWGLFFVGDQPDYMNAFVRNRGDDYYRATFVTSLFDAAGGESTGIARIETANLRERQQEEHTQKKTRAAPVRQDNAKDEDVSVDRASPNEEIWGSEEDNRMTPVRGDETYGEAQGGGEPMDFIR